MFLKTPQFYDHLCMCHPQWVNGAAVKEIKSVSLAFFRVCLELLDMQLACDNWKSREWEWGWGCGWWWGIPESGGRELADWFIISLNYYQSDSVRGTALAKLINNQNKSIHSLERETSKIATSKLQLQHFRCRFCFSHLIYILNWKG